MRKRRRRMNVSYSYWTCSSQSLLLWRLSMQPIHYSDYALLASELWWRSEDHEFVTFAQFKHQFLTALNSSFYNQQLRGINHLVGGGGVGVGGHHNSRVSAIKFLILMVFLLFNNYRIHFIRFKETILHPSSSLPYFPIPPPLLSINNNTKSTFKFLPQ